MSNHQSPNGRRASAVHPDAFLAACPSRAILARLGEKWALLAIAALLAEPQHFGELHRRLQGVSQKMLTQTLRSLERDGLIHREILDARPIRVKYSLTALGAEFAGHAMALKEWIETNLPPIKKQQYLYDQKQ
jgi:DNA-binding HxlR family transcriptional regulator